MTEVRQESDVVEIIRGCSSYARLLKKRGAKKEEHTFSTGGANGGKACTDSVEFLSSAISVSKPPKFIIEALKESHVTKMKRMTGVPKKKLMLGA